MMGMSITLQVVELVLGAAECRWGLSGFSLRSGRSRSDRYFSEVRSASMDTSPPFTDMLLVPIGIICIVAAVIHGHLGLTKLIAPADFRTRQARAFVVMIWHYSTLTWAAIGVCFAATPWLVPADQQRLVIGLMSLPILYGVIGNFIISRGRHPGWAIFAFVIAAANLVVWS
jgi:hypothetical protein